MKVNDNQRISGEALRAEIYRKGYTLKSASKALGLTDNFFSNVIQKNRLRQHYFPIIEEKLGIKPDKYVKQIIHPDIIKEMGKELKIVYTPFNGTGNVPARRILKEVGFANLIEVPEQEMPDPNYTTLE